MKKQKSPSLHMLLLGFILCIFAILVVSMSIFSGIILLLVKAGRLADLDSAAKALPVMFSAFICLLIGLLLSWLIIRLPLRPVKKLIHGMQQLAQGNFSARIQLGSLKWLKELSDSFNALAGELENTEMLRSDFVNHFSHEFKTPIVSIHGFAKLLQRPNITDENRAKYANIIADESMRLSNMATNVLNLTKIENQHILTDTAAYNLSEQIRKCILTLQKRWSEKNLNMDASFDEIFITANAELMQQVWINLLDNAIKFAPENSTVSCCIEKEKDYIKVSVKNEGQPIDEKDMNCLFDKFWQGDTSHASEGTGIGLSLVKSIIKLHKGYIHVQSDTFLTVFVTYLPIFAIMHD